MMGQGIGVAITDAVDRFALEEEPAATWMSFALASTDAAGWKLLWSPEGDRLLSFFQETPGLVRPRSIVRSVGVELLALWAVALVAAPLSAVQFLSGSLAGGLLFTPPVLGALFGTWLLIGALRVERAGQGR